MGNFKEHSQAGIKTFFWSMIIIIPIILWREHEDLFMIAKNSWRVPVCFGLTYLAALFPDIDIKSKSQKIIYLIIVIFIALLIFNHYYGWAAGVGFFAALGIIFKHRGFLHTKTAAILLPLPLLILPLFINAQLKNLGFEFYLATVFGYFSHLIADNMLSIEQTKAKFNVQKLKNVIRRKNRE